MTTSAIGNNAKTAFALHPLPKPLRKTEKDLDAASRWSSLIRVPIKIADVVCKISKPVCVVGKSSKLFDILLAPFLAKKVVDDVIKVVTKPIIADKVTAAANAVVNSSEILESTEATFSLLEKLDAIGSSATAWLPVVGIIVFVVSFLKLGLDANAARKSISLRSMLSNGEKEIGDASGVDAKADALGKTLTDLQSRNVTDTRKKLLFSKEFGLEKSVVELQSGLTSGEKTTKEKAVQQGEKLVRTLAGRAKTELTLSIAKVVNRILTIVGLGLLFIPPVAPIGVVILAVTSVASFVMWYVKTHCINHNPPLLAGRATEIR